MIHYGELDFVGDLFNSADSAVHAFLAHLLGLVRLPFDSTEIVLSLLTTQVVDTKGGNPPSSDHCNIDTCFYLQQEQATYFIRQTTNSTAYIVCYRRCF